MRKLSCKWPVWFTLFALAMPILYVFFGIGHPETLSADELIGKAVAAVFFIFIIWLFYGIACLFASPNTNTTKHPNDDKPDIDADKHSVPRESRKSKKCPFCAEEIQAESIKCHFCGENLETRL